ncbi:ATP-binding protein [uncultured Microbacterium sp.]|uniref:ATP-binding protein n=1 Tax=uncultured Microbacterium sp. TaxID=191216 RepID=UPI0028E237D0|nr:ATP-binding protein [uncultured Microbacterium sp.]
MRIDKTAVASDARIVEFNRLLDAPNFIRAIRDSGYVSLASAIAELIDNAIQADASVIDISVARDSSHALPTITVEDDGIGMDQHELGACLQFGGSSRFDSRRSIGRYGMGLPTASLSQARRVEVTTWQPASPTRTVSLDVDEIVSGEPALCVRETGDRGASMSGCRVTWIGCDRIEYRRLAWLDRALHRDLGQMFRRFLTTVTIVRINGKTVLPIDPLMLNTDVDGASAQLAFDPLQYEIDTGRGGTGVVTIRFSMLPVAEWHALDNATKRRIGVVGHGGVSILRAGREIARGWHLMGLKRKENYDDWWRCEIEFDPDLDEHFGITVNKQGVRPSVKLREALEPDLESIARLLNSRVRQAFEQVKFEAAVQRSCLIAAAADADLPVIRTSGRAQGALAYRFAARPLAGESMFELTLVQRLLDVTLNSDHAGFAALYRPLHDMGEAGAPLRTSLELLLLSFARSAITIGMSQSERRDLVQAWGATYGRMLQRV